jgi:hypothetical protein
VGEVPSGFICTVCGVTATVEGDPPEADNPVRLERRTACRYKDEPKENPAKMCERIARIVKYSCSNCGRMSSVPDFLCYPQRIKKEAKKIIKKKARAR